MNTNLNAHLYLLFALLLLTLGWKISHTAKDMVTQAQAQQTAKIEKALAAME